MFARSAGWTILARSEEGAVEKQSQSDEKDQPKNDRPETGPDQTTMFNPQTQSYDVRQKTPAEIQRDRAASESRQATRHQK
jgi:hypothetical protein